MSPSILVAYTTRYGSTEEISGALAAGLRDAGCTVRTARLVDVDSLEEYDAVILGAPLQMNHWHKDVFSFLRRHQRALAELPKAVFVVGPVTEAEQDWEGAVVQLESELARVPWLRPIEKKIFGGRFDPDRLTGAWRLLPARSKLPCGDLVNLEEAAAWGRSLPEKLGVACT